MTGLTALTGLVLDRSAFYAHIAVPVVLVAQDWYAQWDIEADGLTGLAMLVVEKTPEQKLAEVLEPWHRGRKSTDVFWVL